MNDINAYIIKLVQHTARKYASTEIPDFDEVRSGLGLVVKEVLLPPTINGAIEGRTILINSRIQSRERIQFTLFHEITHHLIDVDEELISILHDATWNQNGEYERQVERLCNIGAAEFLMPHEEFAKLYQEQGFSVDLILSAARHFGSSTIATAIQLAQIAPHSCIIAICEYGLIANEAILTQRQLFNKENCASKPKLHVIYAASSPATKYMLARDVTIPNDHIANQAFIAGHRLEGKSYIPFRKGNQMPCECEALPDKDRNRVYVVFHLSPPPTLNPDQLTFV